MAKTAKQTPWLKHVLSVKTPGMSLGDAMKLAKKTYKKGGDMAKHTGGGENEVMVKPSGGGLLGTVAGGRRRKHKGGQLYSFGGGPYVGSDLSDGAARFPAFNLTSMQFPGANPSAMTGGRRTRRRRRSN